MLFDGIDVIEEEIKKYEAKLLSVLLFDRTTRQNIIWATDNYIFLGDAFHPSNHILPELVTGNFSRVIQPRIAKSLKEQDRRTKKKAEVFTPSWICNEQNNLIDEEWFGEKNVFNKPLGTSWYTNTNKVVFPNKKTKSWQKYVDAKRLEVSCGEAPYLASRYDTVTGDEILINNRIGLLDRKIRVVNENTQTKEDWLFWVMRAYQSVYGYEFQGDNLLLARENLLLSFFDYYLHRFEEMPEKKDVLKIAKILSWNIWQMDGTKYVVPYSCTPIKREDITLFGTRIIESPCPGCKNGTIHEHTGKYCRIFDWRENASLLFVSTLKGELQEHE